MNRQVQGPRRCGEIRTPFGKHAGAPRIGARSTRSSRRSLVAESDSIILPRLAGKDCLYAVAEDSGARLCARRVGRGHCCRRAHPPEIRLTALFWPSILARIGIDSTSGGIDSIKAIPKLQPIQNSRFPDLLKSRSYTQASTPWSTPKETQ